MSTVKDTCACGAKFEFTEQKGWGRGCDTMHNNGLLHMKRAEINMCNLLGLFQ